MDVNIFTIFVKKILKKMAYRFIGDVAADDNVPISIKNLNS